MKISFLQILFSTRKAVKNNVSFKFMLVFASLSGMANLISNQRERIVNYFFVHFDKGLLFIGLLIMGVVLAGSVVGIIKFYLESGIFYLFGKVLGGSPPFKKIQVAISFYYVPLTVSLFLLIVDVIVSNFPNQSIFLIAKMRRGFWLVQLICAGWGLIILARGISEVQDFSIIKTILNLFLSFIVIFSLLGLILK